MRVDKLINIIAAQSTMSQRDWQEKREQILEQYRSEADTLTVVYHRGYYEVTNARGQIVSPHGFHNYHAAKKLDQVTGRINSKK